MKRAARKPVTFLITAGPTIEDIDPVRFISNRATGRLGVALAQAALSAGCRAILIHGPVNDEVLRPLRASKQLKRIAVRSAAEMHRAVMKEIARADVAVMNAAVADFAPVAVSAAKLKKAKQSLILKLRPTVDILRELGKLKARRKDLVLIGFALETGTGRTEAARKASRLAEARRKLKDKRADAIVLDTPAAMGSDRAHFTIVYGADIHRDCGAISKPELANLVVAYAAQRVKQNHR
jgi:phosphopantothenoylcysteine decarboxylase / phosphopantothenate---cysteine ligase